MIHPFNLFFPFFLLLMAVIKALRTHMLRWQWKSICVSALLLCVCLISYTGLNARFNGFFGLTNETNATLFGKVLEYHMQDLPVPAQYASIQADAHASVMAGKILPWDFIERYPTKPYDANGWDSIGSFAWYLILHNPGTYLIDSTHDLLQTWLEPATLYAAYDLSPVSFYPHDIGNIWVNKLLDLSTFELDLYLLLPLLLIGLGGGPGDIPRTPSASCCSRWHWSS